MQRSALLRAELEDAVAGMTPAARAVFEGHTEAGGLVGANQDIAVVRCGGGDPHG